MKKVLLGSTAIVGVALLASASALAAEKPTISFGANLEFDVGWVEEDFGGGASGLGASNRGYAFVTDTEFTVKGKGEADNGLKYSAKIEFEGDQSSGGNTDEVVLSLQGSWGRVDLGDEDGAEDRMLGGYTGVGSAGAGGIDGDVTRFLNNPTAAGSFPDIIDTSDATKITYYTPRINGVQFAASFTPDDGDVGRGGGGTETGSLENHVGIGVNYTGNFNDVDIGIGAAVSTSNVEDTTTGGVKLEDVGAYGIGATFATNGFKIGGSYIDNGDGQRAQNTPNDDRDVWTIGLGYSGFENVALELGYLHAESGNSVAGGGDDENDIVALSATYSVGPGLALLFDLYFFDFDFAAPAAADNDGTVLIIGTRFDF